MFTRASEGEKIAALQSLPGITKQQHQDKNGHGPSKKCKLKEHLNHPAVR